MEAAIRWSPRNEQDATRRFLIADVANNRIQLGAAEYVKDEIVSWHNVCQREKLPNFSAFDWSRDDDSIVAIGTSVGECRILSLDAAKSSPDILTLPVRLQRKCNSISFSRDGHLAVGLDRIRGDTSLNIYDLNSQGTEPVRRLTGAEVITNVKFFSDQPRTLVAGSGGVSRHGQSLKLFDLRESVSANTATVPTRHVHLVSLDSLDENYFASAGPAAENALSVWDKRRFSGMSTAASPHVTGPAVLEIRSVFSQNSDTRIWSLRYSSHGRGSFAVLSADGRIRYIETIKTTASAHEDSKLFVTKSHDVDTYGRHTINGAKQIIGFDHVSPGILTQPSSILMIDQARKVRAVDVRLQPSIAKASALGDVAVAAGPSIFTCSNRLRNGAMHNQSLHSPDTVNPRSHLTGESAHLSSRERQHRFKLRKWTAGRNSLALALEQMDMQRRRCLAGYLFDCDRNVEIVKDDPWLVEMWETVKKLRDMATNEGMVHRGLDLSYFGAYDIWFATFDRQSQRLRRPPPSQEEFSKLVKHLLASRSYPDFQGVRTDYPERRQLALSICGWKFDERRLREKCGDIISRKEYYKAIVVAVAHGRKDMAIDILKSLTRTRAIENSGLAAVIACTAVSEEQRRLCGWMAEEAEDPYLKALLAYFISGNWQSIIDMTELPLQYRLAVALKYLEDDALSTLLTDLLNDVVAAGDTEGILVTGLTEHGTDLFQNYIERFNDLQTAVLAMSFPSPGLISNSSRREAWQMTYFDQLQAWAAFPERIKFITDQRALAQHRLQSNGTVTPSSPSATETLKLRCTQCEKPIVRQRETDYLSDTLFPWEKAKRSVAEEGTECQRCGRRLPRCAICMYWQGAARIKESTAGDMGSRTGTLIGLCIRCRHSFHVHHAKEWFSKHAKCPTPDCSCSCNDAQQQVRAFTG